METTILKLRTQACQEALTLTHVNRFAVLDTVADDEVQDNDQNERFTTVRSNRHKRVREHSSPTQAVAAEAPSGIAVRQRRGPLVLGKSSSASVVAAANKLRKKKSIFCVDNVNMSCTAEDMISFITAMPIEVVSCFEVKPRRRRNDSASSVNRKAFRIGIYSDDVDRFLNADMRPDSITISEWFFKPPSADTDNSRQQQQQKRINAGGAISYSTQSASTSVAAASCSATATTAAQTTDGPPVSEDHDETILAAYDEVTMDTAVANDGE